MSKKRRYKGTAKKALALARENKKRLCAEKKCLNGNISLTNVTNAGGFNNITQIVQGDAHNQREGDVIKSASLLLRGYVGWNAAAPNAIVRLIGFYKITDSNNAPTIRGTSDTDLLEDAAIYPLQPLDWHNRKQYKVIFDELFVGNPDSTDNLVFKRFIKLNHKIYYSTTDATCHRKGRIYWGYISDTAANHPQFALHARYCYYDN